MNSRRIRCLLAVALPLAAAGCGGESSDSAGVASLDGTSNGSASSEAVSPAEALADYRTCLIGFGVDGHGILMNPQTQSAKLIAVWSELTPLPRSVGHPASMIAGVFGFAFRHAVIYRQLSPAWPAGIWPRKGWEDTSVSLPEDAPKVWTDQMTGRRLEASDRIGLSTVFEAAPVGLLIGGGAE